MGGPGSGNWYRWSTKPTVEDGFTLNLYRLIRGDIVRPGASDSGSITWYGLDSKKSTASVGYESDLRDQYEASIRLLYSVAGDSQDYKIQLTCTVPEYGGRRWWFVCPVLKVKVAKLYLPAGEKIFASRGAFRLAYTSQNLSREDRLINKAHALRRRLGGKPGSCNPIPERPKGMHDTTYRRIVNEIRRLETKSLNLVAKRLKISV